MAQFRRRRPLSIEGDLAMITRVFQIEYNRNRVQYFAERFICEGGVEDVNRGRRDQQVDVEIIPSFEFIPNLIEGGVPEQEFAFTPCEVWAEVHSMPGTQSPVPCDSERPR